MIAFPNCKINLGLRITGKRNDGFHNIASVFYPVPLKDALEILHAGNTKNENDVSLHLYGLPVEGDMENNLCTKAYRLLKKDFSDLLPVAIHLYKHIPMGAGLGGGSSDGAFILQLLNRKFNLQLSNEQLLNYALQLGSDCPFFIYNRPAYATGRGEKLEAVSLDLSGYYLVLVSPNIHINTGWAFSQLNVPVMQQTSDDLLSIIQQPVATWKDQLMNDFEMPVFKQYPAIQLIRDQLYELGALYAAMSGSGSTVFGIFDKKLTATLPFEHRYETMFLGRNL